MSKLENSFKNFVDIVAKLRDPNGGCPWDLEQTHLTLRPYLIEEAYEVLEAIDLGVDRELRDELGDLLLQVVLHSQLARERNAFDITDVVNSVAEKMVRRHPHVFGTASAKTSGEVLKNWEAIKAEERGKKTEKPASLLDGVPQSLPALVRAQRLGEKASRVGFDWEQKEGVWEKVLEELAELKVEMAGLSDVAGKALTTAPKERDPEVQKRVESELGDLLFSLCQLGRWLGVSAEDSLRGTSERFLSRFRQMELSSEKPLASLSAEELEALWNKAKQSE